MNKTDAVADVGQSVQLVADGSKNGAGDAAIESAPGVQASRQPAAEQIHTGNVVKGVYPEDALHDRNVQKAKIPNLLKKAREAAQRLMKQVTTARACKAHGKAHGKGKAKATAKPNPKNKAKCKAKAKAKAAVAPGQSVKAKSKAKAKAAAAAPGQSVKPGEDGSQKQGTEQVHADGAGDAAVPGVQVSRQPAADAGVDKCDAVHSRSPGVQAESSTGGSVRKVNIPNLLRRGRRAAKRLMKQAAEGKTKGKGHAKAKGKGHGKAKKGKGSAKGKGKGKAKAKAKASPSPAQLKGKAKAKAKSKAKAQAKAEAHATADAKAKAKAKAGTKNTFAGRRPPQNPDLLEMHTTMKNKFQELSPEERQQLASAGKQSADYAYWKVMHFVMGARRDNFRGGARKGAGVDTSRAKELVEDCHTELMFFWEDWIHHLTQQRLKQLSSAASSS